MTAYEETKKLTKVLFDSIHAKTFNSRVDFDHYVTSVILNNKQNDGTYRYNSLYFNCNKCRDFMFHVTISRDGCYSVTTFSFNMLHNDDRFKNENNTYNISTYIGTPGYWFTSADNRPYVEEEYTKEV